MFQQQNHTIESLDQKMLKTIFLATKEPFFAYLTEQKFQKYDGRYDIVGNLHIKYQVITYNVLFEYFNSKLGLIF